MTGRPVPRNRMRRDHLAGRKFRYQNAPEFRGLHHKVMSANTIGRSDGSACHAGQNTLRCSVRRVSSIVTCASGMYRTVMSVIAAWGVPG